MTVSMALDRPSDKSEVGNERGFVITNSYCCFTDNGTRVQRIIRHPGRRERYPDTDSDSNANTCTDADAHANTCTDADANTCADSRAQHLPAESSYPECSYTHTGNT